MLRPFVSSLVSIVYFSVFFFFFQAEDGIRDGHVTGVQTCALPISTFIENLGGVDFENRRVMTIRDRYEAAVPVVVEAVTRKQAVFVEDAAFLRQHTDAPIKWALPGQIGRAHV